MGDLSPEARLGSADACLSPAPLCYCVPHHLDDTAAHVEIVMQVAGSEYEDSRLLLCEATAVIMRQTFKLLGITPLYRI